MKQKVENIINIIEQNDLVAVNNYIAKEGCVPEFSLFYCKTINMAKLCLNYGAKIESINSDYRTPIIEILEKKLVDVASYLLDNFGEKINVNFCPKEYYIGNILNINRNALRDYRYSGAEGSLNKIKNINPLAQAVELKNEKVVNRLLELGADPNKFFDVIFIDFYDEKIQVTALHRAIVGKNRQIVKSLLEHGASVHLKNGARKNAILISLEEADHEMSLILIPHYSNLNFLYRKEYKNLMDDNPQTREYLNNYLKAKKEQKMFQKSIKKLKAPASVQKFKL